MNAIGYYDFNVLYHRTDKTYINTLGLGWCNTETMVDVLRTSLVVFLTLVNLLGSFLSLPALTILYGMMLPTSEFLIANLTHTVTAKTSLTSSVGFTCLIKPFPSANYLLLPSFNPCRSVLTSISVLAILSSSSLVPSTSALTRVQHSWATWTLSMSQEVGKLPQRRPSSQPKGASPYLQLGLDSTFIVSDYMLIRTK